MKKTYVTSMPNQIGAFLKASQCFSALKINITRVSYNKAVDSHTLFIDAEGTEEQLKKLIANRYEVIKYKKFEVMQDIQKIYKEYIKKYLQKIEK